MLWPRTLLCACVHLTFQRMTLGFCRGWSDGSAPCAVSSSAYLPQPIVCSCRLPLRLPYHGSLCSAGSSWQFLPKLRAHLLIPKWWWTFRRLSKPSFSQAVSQHCQTGVQKTGEGRSRRGTPTGQVRQVDPSKLTNPVSHSRQRSLVWLSCRVPACAPPPGSPLRSAQVVPPGITSTGFQPPTSTL